MFYLPIFGAGKWKVERLSLFFVIAAAAVVVSLPAVQVGGNETRHHVKRVVFAIVHLKQGVDNWVNFHRGLVDSARDCRQSRVRFPRPAPLPQKTSAGSPAQMTCSAQEESPQRRKFNEDEPCKILYCKSKKKLKRVPGRAPNYWIFTVCS